MASNLPYFKWYPKDAETDILYCRMTDQERGLYHHCLNVAWVNGGLPSDLSDMAESLNRPVEYLERMWPRLSKCFRLLSDKWVNPRQEEERRKAVEISDKRSSAGKQGGRPQKQKLSKSKANAYGSGYASEYQEGGVGETKLDPPPMMVHNEWGREMINPIWTRWQDALRASTEAIKRAKDPAAYERAILRRVMA